MNQTKSTPKFVYTPDSQVRNPRNLARGMWRDLKKSKELAWRLFVRDISAQYRQSFLGIAWAFIPPIAMAFVFIFLQSKKVVSFGATDIPYPVFTVVGTTLWQVFAESINAPLKSVMASKPMLAKINFPREALIVSAFYQSVFGFLIKSVIIVAVLILYPVNFTVGTLFAPIVILMMILFGLTIGLLLTPIGTLYKDISSGLTVILQFWFFVTPVVYPPPQTFPYSIVAVINPVSPLLIAARDLITKGVLTNTIPFIVVCFLTICGMLLAWLIFRIALPIIIERMSA
jgi:lipopolysaccharide transport system permease protein